MKGGPPKEVEIPRPEIYYNLFLSWYDYGGNFKFEDREEALKAYREACENTDYLVVRLTYHEHVYIAEQHRSVPGWDK